MKKIILILLIASALFAQGRVSTKPVWSGFKKIASNQTFDTSGSPTKTFKAGEILGAGTIWLEASSATSATITCEIYLVNKASGSQAMIDKVTFDGLESGGNPKKFGDRWTVADEAFFKIKTSTGSVTLDVYVGVE